MTILLFLGVLLVLIVVHEWGHFLAARMFGIKVEEFGVGYPPRAWRLGKLGDTEYTLNWLPFGGFVKIYGESIGADVPESERAKALVTQVWWKQAIVFVAGVTFNMLLAFVLFIAAYMLGMPASVDESQVRAGDTRPSLVVTGTVPGSPADTAGLKPGDVIVSLTGQGADELNSPLPSEMQRFVREHAGQEIGVRYTRIADGREIELNATLTPAHGILHDKQGTPAVGVRMGLVARRGLGFIDAVRLSAIKTYRVTHDIAVGTVQFIKQALTASADWATVAGPVGIVGMVGDASALGLAHLANFVAVISINLAIINMLPVPALDGGRLLIVLIEAVMRRRVPSVVAGWLNTIGFSAIIALMLVVTYHDVLKLIM